MANSSNNILEKTIDFPELTVATVFSGIGAFETALKQMNIDHKIIFACDNGERELKFSYKQLANLCKDLNEHDKFAFVEHLWNHYDDSTTDEESKKSYVEIFENIFFNQTSNGSFELPYECIMLLTTGMSTKEREEYVDRLYEQTGKENYVRLSYLANYDLDKEHWHEDIRFIDSKQYVNQVDILVGGSPCQSFSTYGKKLGLEDTRGTLFYYYANLIKTIHPKVFIYENVNNLIRHDNGRTWEVMRATWESLNYVLSEPTILNAQHYGIPQKRERLFLVGFRKDVIGDQVFEFPERQELTTIARDYLETNVDAKYYLGELGFEWVTNTRKNRNKTRYNRDIIGCQTANQQDNWIGDLLVEPVQEWQLTNESIHKRLFNGEMCVARKMTPTECLRLMGFKNFTQVVDDKQLYRQSGNSIVVNVLEALLQSILPIINIKI